MWNKLSNIKLNVEVELYFEGDFDVCDRDKWNDQIPQTFKENLIPFWEILMLRVC